DAPGVTYKVVNQEYHFQDLSQILLPVAYDPVSLTADTTLRYDPATSMLAAPDRTTTGFSYTVQSKIVTPSKDLLDSVRSLDSDEASPYLQLPPIPQSI